MSNKKFDISTQLKEAVQEAIATGDFARMNEIVSDSVTKALAEAKHQTQQIKEQADIQRKETIDRSKIIREAAQTQQQSTFLAPIKVRKVGKAGGILLTVFGGIGTGFASLAVLSAAILLLSGGALAPLICSGVILSLFIKMIQRGGMKRKRIKRAERYAALCGDNSYINIDDLAKQTGKSSKYILKDVKKMIKKGFYPEGHLDAAEKCLILSDDTFREYLRLEKQREILKMEEKAQKVRDKISGETRREQQDFYEKNRQEQKSTRQESPVKEQSGVSAVEESSAEYEDPSLNAMIKEGNECIRRLRESNDEIDGEVISEKLYQLEKLLTEIFDRVKEHPEQMPQMRKFMDYYLPTTVKLVEAYADFDKVSVPGPEIISAKQEIEKTLDTIIQAFSELLNKLFQASVFDVTTDAQVLQTMLAKEGLTGSRDFEQQN